MMMTDDQIFLHLDKLVAYRGCTSKTGTDGQRIGLARSA